MDDDDKERSRGIPSRTGIGKRGSVVEKFPSLGEPLILFGGLITIPFWGYLNTPIALMEVMVSDLPHVMYHPPVNGTKEEEENRLLIAHAQRDKIKAGGLKAVKGLNLNFTKPSTETGEDLLKKIKRKGSRRPSST